MSQPLYIVGKIVNTHGIRGELKVKVETHFPERFHTGSQLVIVDAQEKQMSVEVESSRFQKDMVVIRFKQFTNINQVEQYKGCLLKMDASSQQSLQEGQYYYHQIMGCTVVTDDHHELGHITEILSPGANDVWVVHRSGKKDILIPVIDDVVKHIDIHNKRVIIQVMEGLIEE